MMKIYASANNKKAWKKLENNPLFLKIYEEIKHNPNCILRDLKAKFPEHTFEKTLDEMIDLGVISRENRRYQVILEVEEKPIPSKLLLLTKFKQYSKEEQTAAWGMYLLQYPYVQEKTMFVKGGSPLDSQLSQIPKCSKSVVDSNSFTLISFQTIGGTTETVHDYFEKLREKQELSENEQRIFSLIGDVSIDFSMNEFSKIVLAMSLGKSLRKNIFFEAAILFGIVSETQVSMTPIDSGKAQQAFELLKEEIGDDLSLSEWIGLGEYLKGFQTEKHYYLFPNV